MPVLELLTGAKAYGLNASAAAFSPYASFESISTVNLTSTSASVTITSIPSTFTHLQLRYVSRTAGYAASAGQAYLYFNDNRSTLYAFHGLYGSGSTPTSDASFNNSEFYTYAHAASNSHAAIWGCTVLDIFDYANSNKFKTTRAYGGYNNNSAGLIVLRSGLWRSTSTITSIVLTPQDGHWAANSRFALYGIRG